jgi:hypothetical protein
LLILVLVLVAGSAGGAGYFYWRSHHTRQLADPTTVALPPQTVSSSKLRSYFTHGGKAGTPRALTDAAVGVPDKNLSAAAINHVQSVINYLGHCGTQPKLLTEARHAAFTATVLGRMLARDGIR